MKIIEFIVKYLPNIKERLNASGTGRGIMAVVGIALMAYLHPEEAKKYIEIVALILIYGASNILRKK